MKVGIVLKYKNKEYRFIDDGYGDMELAKFMWEEGNYSCDCNKSLFINRNCDKHFKEMDCGDEIELKSVDIE